MNIFPPKQPKPAENQLAVHTGANRAERRALAKKRGAYVPRARNTPYEKKENDR